VFPLRDNIPTDRFPVVTVILIALNCIAYFFLQPKTGHIDRSPCASTTMNEPSGRPVYVFVFSKRTWDSMSKEDQDLLKKRAREAQFEQRKLWDAYVGEATAKLKAAGVQFVEADKKAFYAATQPVRDKYGAKYAELIKRIEATT